MDFKALFRRYRTSKIGFQPTIFDFLKFVAFSAPNEINFISVNKTTHTLHIIVNQPYNIIFLFLLTYCHLKIVIFTNSGKFLDFLAILTTPNSPINLQNIAIISISVISISIISMSYNHSRSLKGFKIFDWTPIG